MAATETVSGVFCLISGSHSDVVDWFYKNGVKGTNKVQGMVGKTDSDDLIVLVRR